MNSHPTFLSSKRLLCLGVILCLAFLGPYALLAAPAVSNVPAQSSAWTPAENLSQNSGRSIFPSIAAARNSRDLVLTWTDYTTTTDSLGEILARTRSGETGLWSDPVNLSESPYRDEGVVAYADANGAVHVAWTERNPGSGTSLLYRRWLDGKWSPTQALDYTPVYHPAPYTLYFVEDSAGVLWLFVSESSGVSYTMLLNGEWKALSDWAYIPGMNALVSIIAGPDGLFHVAALGKNQGNVVSGCDPWLFDGYYATTDGSTWSPLVNLAYTGTVSYDMGLAYDSSGALHYFWSDNSPTCSLDSERSAIYERVLQGGEWSARTEVTTPNEGQATEDLVVVADSTGVLRLAWSEGVFDDGGAAVNLAVHYRSGSAAGWGDEEVVWDSPQDDIVVDVSLLGGLVPTLVWEGGLPTAEEVLFSERLGSFHVFLPMAVRQAGATP